MDYIFILIRPHASIKRLALWLVWEVVLWISSAWIMSRFLCIPKSIQTTFLLGRLVDAIFSFFHGCVRVFHIYINSIRPLSWISTDVSKNSESISQYFLAYPFAHRNKKRKTKFKTIFPAAALCIYKVFIFASKHTYSICFLLWKQSNQLA